MKTTRLLAVVALLATLSACRKTEYIDPNVEIPGLGGYAYEDNILADGTNLDEWLRTAFLDEYNIEIVYRWDAVKMYKGISTKLVPIEIEKVKPMMQTLSSIWFRPYLECASAGFLQRYTPKTVILAGSPEYASDGNATVLGTAEGAVKIFLTNGNAFSSSNRAVLKDYMHVIEHEFVHVLNQNIKYDNSFESISKGTYDPTNWMDFSYDNHQAWERGFLSNYSMYSADEDYAEILSLLLINGPEWFEEEVIPIAQASTVDPLADEKLRQKVAHVEKYLLESFGINFFDLGAEKGLITHVQEAIDYVIENSLNN